MVNYKGMDGLPASAELICVHPGAVWDVRTAHLLNEPLMAVLIELVSFHVIIKLPYIFPKECTGIV